ncbi:allergen Bos d 2-like [Delphinus delphis]|uniref:allergen Bos d 2-like n=1 Tax=Delphinus delphis TaxID=9728 RepID=UPI0028C4B2FA|nr:allergen Bos d 2-like [Delphinus delphis]
MKILLLSLVFGLVCADQEPPPEEALSKITGEWRTIYIASDDVDKTHENGPLRGHIHRTECSNNCETTYITFYTKMQCSQSTQSFRPLANHTGPLTDPVQPFRYYILTGGTWGLQLVLDNDEAWNPAKGSSLSEEEFNKFEELTKDKCVPTENTEDVIATGKVPEANVCPR